MSKNDFYNQLLKEESQLSAALESIRKLKVYYENNNDVPQKTIEFQEPKHEVTITVNSNGYDKDWLQPEKVFYALNQIRAGVVMDVARHLVKIDSTLSLEKAKEIATIHCSQMYRDGLIGAKKIGNKNRYFILDGK